MQSTMIACGKAPGYGARTFAKSTRNPSVDPASDRRRADGDEDRARPIALPDRAGDEESVDLDRQHEEIVDGEGRAGRRADRQQARAAPGQRHRSQLEDGSAQRHPLVQDGEEDQHARDERAEGAVAATAEVRIETGGAATWMITPSVTNLSSAAWASGIVVARKNALIARQKTAYRAHWTENTRRTRSWRESHQWTA